eukprot:UN25715
MEATLAERLGEVTKVLCDIAGKEHDTKKGEEQRQMRETFDKFDRNSSGELNLEEYKKAWRFLGRGGTDDEIKKAFTTVDIDNSGFIEWDEFIFSLEGEDSKKYGLLADMELLLSLIGEVTNDLKDIRADRSDAQKGLYSARGRLGALQRSVMEKTQNLINRMRRNTGESGSIAVSDLETQLKEVFDKADTSKSGKLSAWQFNQAWMSLGVGGNEEHLKSVYQASERFGGSGMDFRTFVRVAKAERNQELEIRARMATLEYLIHKLEGQGDGAQHAKRRLARQKANDDMSNTLLKMIDAVLPISDEKLSQPYKVKQQRYVDLVNAFNKYDTPRQGVLNLSQFKSARRYAGGYTGTDNDLEKEFKEAAGRGNGVDLFEFITVDMGKKANKVGSYGYVKF